jgi:hypothetical protein
MRIDLGIGCNRAHHGRGPDVHLSCLFDDPFQSGPYISAALIEQRQCMRMTIDGISTDAVFSGDPGRADPVHECEVDFFASGMSAYRTLVFVPPWRKVLLIVLTRLRTGAIPRLVTDQFASISWISVVPSLARTLTGGLSPSVPRGVIKTDSEISSCSYTHLRGLQLPAVL